MDILAINEGVIEAFRAGRDPEGMHRDRLLLLTTTGRRSGQPRTSPMMFHRDGDTVVVIASNQGNPEHPAWYLNLVAEPHVTVETATGTYSATASTLTGDDRARVWGDLVGLYGFFADHQEKAGAREIPLVALARQARPA